MTTDFKVSAYSTNVLISGESGTGKEVIARAIHNLGPRKNLPFVAINCAAIPDSLLESEFFGHAKGSFTGAFEKKIGLFEEAGEGTLFLDEIGDLNLPLQAKILRVLQERKIRRIGENQYRPFRARIVAATNCNLRIEVENKRFREDLFFRLNVIPIWIAPLRKRKEDILPLAEFFLKKYCVMNGLVGKRFTKECKEAMLGFQWQGNVRELENFVERALILSNSDSIDAVDLVNTVETTERPDSFSSTLAFEKISQDRVLSIDEMANHYISYVLDLNEGAKDKAAKDLGIDRKTLYRRLKDIEILRIQGKKANALLPAQI